MMNDFISYLNSTNNIGGNSTGSLAEKQVKSPYYDFIKVERKIGETIVEENKSGKFKSYILTGHAGDGKTSVLVQVLKSLNLLANGEGLDESKEFERVFYVKDMSEIPEQKQVALLRKVLSAPKNGKTGMLISNTGPLLNAFISLVEKKRHEEGMCLESDEKTELQSKILTQLDGNEDQEIEVAGYWVVLVNIARVDNVAIAAKILKKILAPNLWEKCAICPKNNECPIFCNRNLLDKQYGRVSAFIDNFYRYLYENDKRMTIRQMVGQISYGITGNLSCERVCSSMLKEPEFTYNFANLFFGYKGFRVERDSLQIRGIQLIQNLSLDAIALNIDYRLFVNHDYSFFPNEIRLIIDAVSKKARKHFQAAKEAEEEAVSQQTKNIKLRKAIRRFYLIYGLSSEEYPEDNIYNQIYGSNFVDYKKMITSAQTSAMIRKLQNVVYNALYIKNTGYLPLNNSNNLLPLTLRREDEIYQSVLLVLGEISKSEIKIVTKRIVNQLEDAEEKYDIFIQIKDALFKLSFPMINYFNELMDGAVTSNSNPALTHGIAALDALLLEQCDNSSMNSGDDCEIAVIVNTTHGQKIKRYLFSENRLYLTD